MFTNRAYYLLKPFLPWAVRTALRRKRARIIRDVYRGSWPIDPNAARKPADWSGWPDQKRFALILTHDVEGPGGLALCPRVMALEQELGFRSVFNFVPEGQYELPSRLRVMLVSGGFEVGVHDLHHDGKLYLSKSTFGNNARRINRYLSAWDAAGFRSGLMHHNLAWLTALNVLYDSSTFDTDPFEPQPDAAGTIFPFLVHRNRESYYVELPYTLAQDFTLFVILQERTIDIWKRKLDWIAENGGMALINTHPDYMHFDGSNSFRRGYPAGLYRDFLVYARTRYQGEFWHATPKEAAAHFARQQGTPTATSGQPARFRFVAPSRERIWVDLDNTPHVSFFKPIVESLEAKGYSVLLTARDAFQVFALADAKGLRCIRVGKHYGKSRIAKLFGLFVCSLQLIPYAHYFRPCLAISHGSRSQNPSLQPAADPDHNVRRL